MRAGLVRGRYLAGVPDRRDILQVLVSTHRRGAETFALELGRGLEARGHRVRSVALAPGSDPAGYDLPTLGPTRMAPATLRALRRQVRDCAVAVAHGSNTLPACALATLGTGVPFAYRNIGDPTYWSSSPARRVRAGISLRRAARIAVLWPGAADAIVRQHGVARERIRIIPNGAPIERFPLVDARLKADARARLGLPAEEPIVLFLGALSPEKNIDVAIRAMASVPTGRLVVTGEGPQRATLEALADDVVPSRVSFVGSTPDPAASLAAADVVVLPSATEGMPGVLIEAGLSGVPVVATDVGGVGEVVVDGETGLLVPPGEPAPLASALTAVLADPGRLGARARAHCEARFELGVVTGLWEDLLAELGG